MRPAGGHAGQVWAADLGNQPVPGLRYHGYLLVKTNISVYLWREAVAGSEWLERLRLSSPYTGKLASLRHLAGELTTEITMLTAVIADLLATHRGYHAIQVRPGSARGGPRSSSPRSGTSAGSAPPPSCARGRG